MFFKFNMYLLTVITKIFHFLPEEIAHRFALSGIKITHSFGLLRILLGKNFTGKEYLQKIIPVRECSTSTHLSDLS